MTIENWPAATLLSLKSATSSSTPLTRGLNVSLDHAREPRTAGTPLTHIDDPHIHAKSIARKVRDVSHVVAPIRNGRNPMRNSSPYRDPAYELWIQVSNPLGSRNIKDGVIEERDQTRDADHGQWLTGEQAENQRGQGGREERFIDAEVAARVTLHVQSEGQCREEVDEEDSYRCGECPVCHAVPNVTPVEG